MNIYKLSIIQETFLKCFSDAALYSRAVIGNNLFEVNNVKKDNKQWLVLAAGLNDCDAELFFKDNPSRALRAKEPLTIQRTSCKMSVLFVLSAFEEDAVVYDKSDRVAPFAPGNGVSFVEIRDARIMVDSIPNNDLGISYIRWDFDLASSFDDPIEKWAYPWRKICGFNPIHAASHFHINYSENEHDEHQRKSGNSIRDLRIATGMPNPLALILSLSAWLSTLT